MRILTVTATVLAVSIAPVHADELTPLPPPAPRPYPYRILDIQPGQIGTEVIPQIESHLGGKLSPMVMQQVVTAPNGRQFEADLTVGYETAAVSIYTTMGDEPFESVKLITGTPVLDGRVISIARRIRKPNAELPEPAEVLAQLAQLYGEPTWLLPDGTFGLEALYVWTPDGQMPQQSEQPCGHTGYDGYAFDDQRQPDEHPECLAVLSMQYHSKAGQSSLSFRLHDLELARIDVAETDRQIKAAVSEGNVKPSDMKL